MTLPEFLLQGLFLLRKSFNQKKTVYEDHNFKKNISVSIRYTRRIGRACMAQGTILSYNQDGHFIPNI